VNTLAGRPLPALADAGAAEFHPLADIFPLLEGAEFGALRDDIQRHGVREPAVLYGGKVLDGRNRARACAELGLPLPVRERPGRTRWHTSSPRTSTAGTSRRISALFWPLKSCLVYPPPARREEGGKVSPVSPVSLVSSVSPDWYAYPWPDELPGLGRRRVEAFERCSRCPSWSWARYGDLVLCLPCAKRVLAGDDERG
jgi:hypothetical protein